MTHVTLLYRTPRINRDHVAPTLMEACVDIAAAVRYRDQWIENHPWMGDIPWHFYTVTREIKC